nr:hypothetical protein [Cereibacter azotoformans]
MAGRTRAGGRGGRAVLLGRGAGRAGRPRLARQPARDVAPGGDAARHGRGAGRAGGGSAAIIDRHAAAPGRGRGRRAGPASAADRREHLRDGAADGRQPLDGAPADPSAGHDALRVQRAAGAGG